MTKELTRFVPARARDLLARVLQQPDLVAAVRALPPRALGALVRRIGLEDAGELVALVTPEQLTRILDEDVWTTARPGGDETFDDQRFALWLEVLLEAGDETVGEKLVLLPEELVTLGLHRQILVFDLDALTEDVAAMDDDDAVQAEKLLGDGLYQELDTYRIVSRRHDGWDAVLEVILALDKNHHEFLARVLEHLCVATASLVEDHGGLYEALSSADMLASDADADREDRRAAEGFVAPAAARSFLGLARAVSAADVLREQESDPVTRAYFRELKAAPLVSPAEHVALRAARPLLALLAAHDVDAQAAPALLGAGGASEGHLFRNAMAQLGLRDAALYARRLEELAFLVNVLSAGSRKDGRAYRPAEAVDDAVTACNLGLEAACASRPRAEAVDVLATISADRLFRIGWRG